MPVSRYWWPRQCGACCRDDRLIPFPARPARLPVKAPFNRSEEGEASRGALVILGSGSTVLGAAIRAAVWTRPQQQAKAALSANLRQPRVPSIEEPAAARIVHDAAHPRYSGIESARLHVNFPELI